MHLFFNGINNACNQLQQLTMDPLETEISKYQQRKDQLCETLMDKETEFAEYIRHLRIFEQALLLQHYLH